MKFDAKVQERDALETQKRQLVISEAKLALERFYADYSQKKEKAISKNKESEESEKTRLSNQTNVWERVWSQIESTAPKVKEDGKKSKVEVKKSSTIRFKEVILSLKNDVSAPGVKAL